MDSEQVTQSNTSGPATGGTLHWGRAALWLPVCAALGVPVAWAADIAGTYFAPLVIFPLVVGAGLGALAVGLVRLMQVGHRPTILTGAVLAALVAVAGQHYAGYRRDRQRTRADAETYRIARRAFPEAVKGRLPKPPGSFADYMRQKAADGRNMDVWQYRAKGLAAWATWAVDGSLVLAAVLAIVIPATRQPYCRRCRTWYRVIHSGRIDGHTAERLIELADVSADECPTSAHYRLVGCQGGCGPLGFALSWEGKDGGTLSVRTWLDAETRSRIVSVLEEARS